MTTYRFNRTQAYRQKDILSPTDHFLHWLAIETAGKRAQIRQLRLKSGRDALQVEIDRSAVRSLAMGASDGTPFIGVQGDMYAAFNAVKWHQAEARLGESDAWIILMGRGPKLTPVRVILPANPQGLRKFMAGRIARLDLRRIAVGEEGKVRKISGGAFKSMRLVRKRVADADLKSMEADAAKLSGAASKPQLTQGPTWKKVGSGGEAANLFDKKDDGRPKAAQPNREQQAAKYAFSATDRMTGRAVTEAQRRPAASQTQPAHGQPAKGQPAHGQPAKDQASRAATPPARPNGPPAGATDGRRPSVQAPPRSMGTGGQRPAQAAQQARPPQGRPTAPPTGAPTAPPTGAPTMRPAGRPSGPPSEAPPRQRPQAPAQPQPASAARPQRPVPPGTAQRAQPPLQPPSPQRPPPQPPPPQRPMAPRPANPAAPPQSPAQPRPSQPPESPRSLASGAAPGSASAADAVRAAIQPKPQRRQEGGATPASRPVRPPTPQTETASRPLSPNAPPRPRRPVTARPGQRPPEHGQGPSPKGSRTAPPSGSQDPARPVVQRRRPPPSEGER